MHVQTGGLFGTAAAFGQPGAVRRPAESRESQGNSIREQMKAQNEKHYSFLQRARQGLALYEEKMKEANAFIQQYEGVMHGDIAEQVTLTRESLTEMELAMEELQESINNEIAEHTFIMSSLEALLGEGNLPVHTLKEYIEAKENGTESGIQRRYTVEVMDELIAAQRETLGGGWSTKA